MKNDKKEKKKIENLNKTIHKSVKYFKPPEDLTVSQWAEKYRRLSAEISAEPGLWKNTRTPYLVEIMNAFTDPKVSKISVVAASQVGKSEVQLNCIGYIIDNDPGSILYIQPTIADAEKFSRLRIAPMIRDTPRLRAKVSDVKTRNSGNTILQKSFPGGMITITGSNSPSALASTPARYIFGDERDRWALSAGTEGNPWDLAEARQTTFYNKKAVEVSTPTIKGLSQIEKGFLGGTQEYYCSKCPECGTYNNIMFKDIIFDKEEIEVNGEIIKSAKNVLYACPYCGCVHDEETIKKQPAKWIAENPSAYEKGHRSFWLNAFVSPWKTWKEIVDKFLETKDDVEKLKVTYNTLFGQLWEERGEIENEDDIINRRENYERNEDGSLIELQEGVLVLTMGVDTQDDRLEYEVVGHGKYAETWGIKRGFIMGAPDTDAPWEKLDEIIDHTFKFKNGLGTHISLTFVDSGGHYTTEVYKQCKKRQHKKVFPIKGKGGESIPFISIPTKQYLDKVAKSKKSKNFVYLYTLGVDAGKTIIMDSLKVKEPGPKYAHFPKDEELKYDRSFFNGLISERQELVETKTGRKLAWVSIPGHKRNEALDCRNYAIAAIRLLDPDFNAIERKIKGLNIEKKTQKKKTKRNKKQGGYNEW